MVTLLLFKLLYFDLTDVETDNHALRINKSAFEPHLSSHLCLVFTSHRYKGFLFLQIHLVLFGATTLLGTCIHVLLAAKISGTIDPTLCTENESTFNASSTSLMCGSLMLFTVLILQCLHRGVHTHRTLTEDLVHLECELVSLEQQKQHEDCAVDIQTFKGLLRCLDDPANIKRIFGKQLVLPPGSDQQADIAEAQEKQLIEVFNMFVTDGSTSLGSEELRSLHLFLRDAAVIDKKVRARYARLHVYVPLSHDFTCPCLYPANALCHAISHQQNPAAASVRISSGYGAAPLFACWHRCVTICHNACSRSVTDTYSVQPLTSRCHQ
jgi:hypothetical protein